MLLHRLANSWIEKRFWFRWALADEPGSRSPPPYDTVAAWALALIDSGQPSLRLIRASCQPARMDWRLTLARAYLALGQLADAEAVLQPVLSASPEAPAAATILLDGYHRANQIKAAP